MKLDFLEDYIFKRERVLCNFFCALLSHEIVQGRNSEHTPRKYASFIDKTVGKLHNYKVLAHLSGLHQTFVMVYIFDI